METYNPKKIELMDTTLRDGEQMDGVSYSPEEKLMIAKKLFKLGISRIEVASARAVEREGGALEKICKYAQEKGRLNDVEVLCFVDETKSVDWIYSCGCKTINLLTKGSEKHCRSLNKTIEQHLIDIKKTIEYARSKGMNVNIYLEDWSSGMQDSKEYVFKMIDALKEIEGVQRIMLADTLGKLSPWKTYNFVKEIVEHYKGIRFDYHGHNDYELAIANSLEAIRAGVNGIHSTINGLGERAGNCSLLTLAIAAKDHLNLDLGLDEKKFIEISRLVESASKIRVNVNMPIVGSNVLMQTAGVHAHGNKSANVYATPINGKRFGKDKDYNYSLGKQSGVSNIELNLAEMGLDYTKELAMNLTKKIRELGAQKTRVTPEDLYYLYLAENGEEQQKPFEILDCTSQISMTGEKKGYIKARVNGQIFEESSVGDGGYDSIMNALKKITEKNNIQLPELVDYEPRIPPGGETCALVETIIEWKNGGKSFKTIGIDTDQTIAAVKATEKMINRIMLRENK